MWFLHWVAYVTIFRLPILDCKVFWNCSLYIQWRSSPPLPAANLCLPCLIYYPFLPIVFHVLSSMEKKLHPSGVNNSREVRYDKIMSFISYNWPSPWTHLTSYLRERNTHTHTQTKNNFNIISNIFFCVNLDLDLHVFMCSSVNVLCCSSI